MTGGFMVGKNVLKTCRIHVKQKYLPSQNGMDIIDQRHGRVDE